MKRKQQRRDEDLLELVVQRMKKIRNDNDHSQEYLIANTGLDIPHFETGKYFPSLSSVAIFCRFYKMSLEKFFEGMEYPLLGDE